MPTHDHIKLGIQEILITVLSDGDVYLHTPENFISTKPNTDRLQKQDVMLGYSYLFDVKHDLFNMVDDGNPAHLIPNIVC